MSKGVKISIVVIVILIVCSILLLLSPLGLMIYGIATENKNIKEKLDNPYINSGFRNWYKVSIEEVDLSFQIPSEWSILEKSSKYTIEDINSGILATGVVYHTDHDPYASETDWLQSLVNFSIQNVEWSNVDSYTSFTAIATFDKFTIEGVQGEQAVFYELILSSGTNYLRFAFPTEQSLSEFELAKYAEAIVYSYCFN